MGEEGEQETVLEASMSVWMCVLLLRKCSKCVLLVVVRDVEERQAEVEVEGEVCPERAKAKEEEEEEMEEEDEEKEEVVLEEEGEEEKEGLRMVVEIMSATNTFIKLGRRK